jgi:hypothetical protein
MQFVVQVDPDGSIKFVGKAEHTLKKIIFRPAATSHTAVFPIVS